MQGCDGGNKKRRAGRAAVASARGGGRAGLEGVAAAAAGRAARGRRARRGGVGGRGEVNVPVYRHGLAYAPAGSPQALVAGQTLTVRFATRDGSAKGVPEHLAAACAGVSARRSDSNPAVSIAIGLSARW